MDANPKSTDGRPTYSDENAKQGVNVDHGLLSIVSCSQWNEVTVVLLAALWAAFFIAAMCFRWKIQPERT